MVRGDRRGGIPRRLGVAAAISILFALLALPAGAGAVTASVSGERLMLSGGPEDNDVKIRIAGEPHSVSVTDTAGVTAGAGCDAESPTSALCGDSSTTALVAGLGDGTNSFAGNSGASRWPHLTSIGVVGGAGKDTIGPDTLDGAPWTVDGGAGDDTITASNENDTLGGGEGNDDINGEPGNDNLFGGPGDDTLFGNTGADKLYGEEGSDKLDGSDGGDLVDGGPGTDQLQGDGSDQSSGDDTLDAVDGEKDTVSCGFGTDIANVDSIDVVGGSSDCEQVNTAAAGGNKTPKPKPKPFKAHCKRKGGHRVCKQPAPLKGRTYKGRSSQGSKVTAGARGRFLVFKAARYTYKCADGAKLDGIGLSIAAGDHYTIGTKGTASAAVHFDPSDGFSGEVVYVVAAFDGRKAAGAIVGNAQVAGHGACTTGRVSWTAKA